MTTQTNTASTATAPSTATDFEFFEGSRSVSAARPQITIRKGGVIIISRAVAVMLGEKLSHVQLAYNPKTGAIGLRATGADTAGAYQVRPQSKGPGRMIGGKRFFKHHGLAADQARAYEAADFGNGIVGFVLVPAAATGQKPAEVVAAPDKAEKPRKSA